MNADCIAATACACVQVYDPEISRIPPLPLTHFRWLVRLDVLAELAMLDIDLLEHYSLARLVVLHVARDAEGCFAAVKEISSQGDERALASLRLILRAFQTVFTLFLESQHEGNLADSQSIRCLIAAARAGPCCFWKLARLIDVAENQITLKFRQCDTSALRNDLISATKLALQIDRTLDQLEAVAVEWLPQTCTDSSSDYSRTQATWLAFIWDELLVSGSTKYLRPEVTAICLIPVIVQEISERARSSKGNCINSLRYLATLPDAVLSRYTPTPLLYWLAASLCLGGQQSTEAAAAMASSPLAIAWDFYVRTGPSKETSLGAGHGLVKVARLGLPSPIATDSKLCAHLLARCGSALTVTQQVSFVAEPNHKKASESIPSFEGDVETPLREGIALLLDLLMSEPESAPAIVPDAPIAPRVLAETSRLAHAWPGLSPLTRISTATRIIALRALGEVDACLPSVSISIRTQLTEDMKQVSLPRSSCSSATMKLVEKTASESNATTFHEQELAIDAVSLHIRAFTLVTDLQAKIREVVRESGMGRGEDDMALLDKRFVVLCRALRRAASLTKEQSAHAVTLLTTASEVVLRRTVHLATTGVLGGSSENVARRICKLIQAAEACIGTNDQIRESLGATRFAQAVSYTLKTLGQIAIVITQEIRKCRDNTCSCSSMVRVAVQFCNLLAAFVIELRRTSAIQIPIQCAVMEAVYYGSELFGLAPFGSTTTLEAGVSQKAQEESKIDLMEQILLEMGVDNPGELKERTASTSSAMPQTQCAHSILAQPLLTPHHSRILRVLIPLVMASGQRSRLKPMTSSSVPDSAPIAPPIMTLPTLTLTWTAIIALSFSVGGVGINLAAGVMSDLRGVKTTSSMREAVAIAAGFVLSNRQVRHIQHQALAEENIVQQSSAATLLSALWRSAEGDCDSNTRCAAICGITAAAHASNMIDADYLQRVWKLAVQCMTKKTEGDVFVALSQALASTDHGKLHLLQTLLDTDSTLRDRIAAARAFQFIGKAAKQPTNIGPSDRLLEQIEQTQCNWKLKTTLSPVELVSALLLVCEHESKRAPPKLRAALVESIISGDLGSSRQIEALLATRGHFDRLVLARAIEPLLTLLGGQHADTAMSAASTSERERSENEEHPWIHKGGRSSQNRKRLIGFPKVVVTSGADQHAMHSSNRELLELLKKQQLDVKFRTWLIRLIPLLYS